MALGPLIPEGAAGVAVLGDALLLLLALFAFAVCAGSLYAWRQTFGAMIDAITSLLTIKVFGLHVNFGWPLDKLNNTVQHALSLGVKESEKAIGKFFYAMGVIVGWMVNFMLASVTTMEHAIGWLIHVHLPKYAKWALRAAFPIAWLTKLIAQEIAKAIPHLGRVVITKTIERVVHTTVKVVHAVAHPGSIALPGITKDLRWLRNREASLSKRLHKVEGLFAAGVLAAVLAQVFGVATKCLRSGNTGKAVRRICGMDANLLDSLLLDSLAIVGAISVVEFAEGLRAIEGEAVKILGVGIREWPS